MDDIPLSEFTPGKAILEPSDIIGHQGRGIEFPERCVMPIYGSIFKRLLAEDRLEILVDVGDILPQPWGIYKMAYNGAFITVAHPGIGAPMAATLMDELIALGCRKFVACGGAGVLDDKLRRGSVVVPSAALRDEGTSFHYLSASRTVEADPAVVEKLETVLENHDVPYVTGLTWTTDGLFRETKERVARRKAEGCIAVEMECAGFLAVAKYRGVTFGQYLSASDCVAGEVWDPRHVEGITAYQEKLFWLSVEAVMGL